MLAPMNDGFAWWLIIVGLAIGVFVSWFLLVRLAREEDDVSALEREHEAEWISSAIERDGGIAPVSLVDEVLDLHQAYLRSPGDARPSPVEMGPPPISSEDVPPRPTA